VIVDYCNFPNKENTKYSSSLSDEENTEKKTKEKDQIEEEKYFTKIPFAIIKLSQLSDKEKFVCVSSQLNLHPYQDKELQPPKTA